MALLIMCPNRDATPWATALRAVDPGLDLRVWPDVGDGDDIEFALTWAHPRGELRRYKNLTCIASMGAGVDHLLSDPQLPVGVPLTRVVDRALVRSMTQYVVLAVLNHYRNFEAYRAYQRQRRWVGESAPNWPDLCVGIMGLGQLGGDAARKLSRLGFRIAGWSRTPKQIDGVQTYAGDEQRGAFLARSHILVCLLPLTSETRDILNRQTFDMLPRGAYVINVARGAHLVEPDLLDALDRGQLSGACLDVFRQEPLPPDHPFWQHPKIIVTPHISSVTDPQSVAPQIVENYRRARTGEPVLYRVDVERGY